MATGANAKLSFEELSSQYGYAAAFWNTSPELNALINQAVSQQWTPDRFKAAFMNTTWYRTQSSSVRSWIEQSTRDPQTTAQQVAQQKLKISNLASKQGITLTDARAGQMASQTLMFGFNDEQLNQALAAEWHYQSAGGTSGNAAAVEEKVRSLAYDYGLDVSDPQVGNLVGGVLAGKYDDNTVADFVKDAARSKYVGLQSYIDAGFSVRQVASPYVQSYANLLEVAPDSVDLKDPRLQKALMGAPDPKTKLPVQQSLYDFEQGVRQDPRWLQTKNAHQEIQTAGMGVLRDMGLYS